jgi:hypothetical protein
MTPTDEEAANALRERLRAADRDVRPPPMVCAAWLGHMMTFKQVSKGAGYRYYTREAAVGDGRKPRGSKLEEEQDEVGVPPGVWMG